jgi:DNA-directed RNA polymerase subunit RPC12/RpoP
MSEGPTLQALWARATQAQTTGEDYEKQLGRGMMEGVMEGVTNIVRQALSNPAHGAASSANSFDQFLSHLEVADKLKRLLGVGGPGADGGHEAGAAPKGDATVTAKAIEVLGNMMIKVMESTNQRLDRTEDRLAQALEKISERMEARQNPDDPLRDIGRSVLQGFVSRNPTEDIERSIAVVERLQAAIGLKKSPEERMADIEEKKILLEHERDLKREERELKAVEQQQQVMENLVRPLVLSRYQMAVPGSPVASADGASGGTPPLYRYSCWSCGKQWATLEPLGTGMCPHCGVTVLANGQASSPQHPPVPAESPRPPQEFASPPMGEEVAGGVDVLELPM